MLSFRNEVQNFRSEFYDHQEFGKVLNVPVYFADSYASWQKGAIENANKLIRQYFPKDTDFRIVTDDKVKEVPHKLNKRPRAKINFSCPLIEFFKRITPFCTCLLRVGAKFSTKYFVV